MKKLPVLRSAKEVYAGVFSHFRELLRIAWLPILLVIVARAVLIVWIDPELEKKHVQSSVEALAPAILFVFLALYLGTAMMAVGFHRFVLLGEKRRGIFGSGLSFARKDILYVWASILIGTALSPAALAALPVASFGAASFFPQGETQDLYWKLAVGFLSLGAPFAAVGLLLGRWILVLPHVAMGYGSSLRFVWQQTRGNSWRIFAYMVLVFLPVGLLVALSLMAQAVSLEFAAAVDAPVYIVTAMLSITCLSVAYREIVGLPPAMQPDPALPA
ncbi:MAG: hypothetical protein K8R18_15680 [Parvibaculum sp.]|uniref:hypothetical protein n=1 Tax=Parvibaculum sp. TaxID=2024848 RepID=UPI0025F4F4B9|nr:hypothetical protein [Parvibaculum sp.]MCE9651059.1 hypothetical protein [Parvibaculum sp.]